MDPMSSCLGFTSAGVPRMLRGGPLVNRQCSNRLIPRHGIVMGARKEKKEDTNSGFYKNTVNLPSTNFSQRANAVKTEPEIQKFWADSKTYEKLSSENPREVYSLHDGPPYANGDIHMGHALNKVLKDFINRYQLLQGKKATLIPGWDCHGLPIELKVLQSLKSKERKDLTPSALRKKAKEFALKTIESQKASFQRLGVWASWDTPYLTLNPEYEAAQIEVFGKMFLEGYIYRGKKPVHWSPSSRTALAEAELEYPDEHISRSVYAAFSIVDADKSKNELVKKHSDALSVAVWTTTPWTLPANRAVAVNPAIVYALVELEDRVLLVAKDLVEAVGHKLEKDLVVIGEVTGNDLAGLHYEHPIQDGLKCKILIGGDYITTESGTGLVHTAPGHGQEDYIVGMREGLEIFSPVDNAGRFTDEFCEGSFAGLSVLDEGNQAIIDHVSKRDVLLLEEKYNHKYPYDWRTKKPTIFRATEQWFASVEGFRDQALEAVRGVQWTPEAGEKRIFNMIEGRNDWCISRQRTWGVPIPVFYDGDGEPVLNQQIISRVAELFREHGSDIWWELEAEDLLPEQYRGEGLQKGMDTMDVWFDSGSSWNAVTKQSPEMTFPADVYLEGSDQHRGWFQSSLLTSVATEGQAPYKKVLTHGFVLDQNGLKMSKSVGNVVDPLKLVNGGNNQKTEPAYGADVLRLWVSSVDYSGDVLVGPEIIKTVSDSYRKIRNTLRYIVSNVNDYDPRTGMSFDELPVLDKYMLRRLATIAEDMEAAYETSSFVRLYQGLMRFATVDLSNFYLDIAKDRLYISGTDDYRRRSCQKVLYHLLEILTRSIAPILPHTAEDLWRNVPWKTSSSVFEAGWIQPEPSWSHEDPETDAAMELFRRVRTDVNKCLDAARNAKRIGSGLAAKVSLSVADDAVMEALQKFNPSSGEGNTVDELCYYLLVSEVNLSKDMAVADGAEFSLVGEESGVHVGVDVASGNKCDRCWVYSEQVGKSENHPLLCDRCEEVMTNIGVTSQPVPELAQ